MTQRRYMENGRVVTRPKLFRLFSWQRFLVVFLPAVAMWCSNPANEVSSVLDPTVLHKLKGMMGGNTSNHGHGSNNRVYQRRVTNYGFFSVKERYNRLSLFVAGMEWECPFQDVEIGELCLRLNAHVSHQKPLLWDPHDRPYTTHRLFCWMLVAAALITSCWSPPRQFFLPSSAGSSSAASEADDEQDRYDRYYHHRLWMDALLSLFVDQDSDWPVLDLPMYWLQANLFLYPTWKLMDQLVSMQREESLFRLFPNPQSSYNYVWSVLVMISMAALFTGLAKTYNNTGSRAGARRRRLHQLGFQAVVAIALGYYRSTYTESSSSPNVATSTLLELDQVLASPIMLTWIMLCLTAANTSFQAALLWFAANMTGHMMGTYQLEHIGVGAAFAGMFKGFRDLLFNNNNGAR